MEKSGLEVGSALVGVDNKTGNVSSGVAWISIRSSPCDGYGFWVGATVGVENKGVAVVVAIAGVGKSNVVPWLELGIHNVDVSKIKSDAVGVVGSTDTTGFNDDVFLGLIINSESTVEERTLDVESSESDTGVIVLAILE